MTHVEKRCYICDCMRRDFIDSLHCPFSGSNFTISNVLAEDNSGIDYGIITSEAGDFPIISGILRLKVDDYRSPLTNLIKNAKAADALLTALEVPSYGRVAAAVNFLDRNANKTGFSTAVRWVRTIKRPLYRALTDPQETFSGTAHRVNSKSWANWQIYRFSMPAFLPVYPFLRLMEGGSVLDFGCGLGHASFLISRRTDTSKVTCADDQFSALYLAKKFFVPGANFICLDGDYPLPFDSGYFSSVFSSDVLHVIDSKVGLCREFQRIVSESGAVILPHLHNKFSPVQFGKPLTPQGYSRLFEGLDKRIVPEDWIVDQFISSDSLDLKKEWTAKDLEDAITGLSMVVSKNVALFDRYTELWERHTGYMTNPTINPVYQISGNNEQWVLKKDVPHSYTGRTRSKGDEHLPDTTLLKLPALDKPAILAFKKSDPVAFTRLARNLVFIETPERFQ